MLFAHLTPVAALDDEDDAKDVDDDEVVAASLTSGVEAAAGPYLILPAPLSMTTTRVLLISERK